MTHRPLKILYVGADRAACKRLAALLERTGYAVTLEAATGRGRAASPAGRGEMILTVAQDGSAPRQPGRRPRGAAGRARSDGKAVTMSLRGLRERVGKTQGEVASRTAMSQPQLSRLETRRDHLISTVRKYVRALGGDIEVVALVNGERVALQDV